MKNFLSLTIAIFMFSSLNTLVGQTGSWVIKNGQRIPSTQAGIIAPSIPSNKVPLMSPDNILINFDDIEVPGFFADTDPASTEYSAQGVTFSGTGFSILNEEGSFSVSGYSSPNFLAWNTMGLTSNFETITFNPSVNNLSFLAASSFSGCTIFAEAFDSDHNSLGSLNVVLTSVVQQISLPYNQIASVEITVDNSTAGIIDDLMFESSPAIPFSMWPVFLGFFVIALSLAFRFYKK